MESIPKIQAIENYAVILQTYGLSYAPVDFYWQVGTVKKVQGWIIHLSVIQTQIADLLHRVIPCLLEENMPFRVVMDLNSALKMMEGALGYKMVGKIVCIYPEDDAQANRLAKKLIALTADFRGPAIPTDRRLGGIVYTRYGSFAPVFVKKEGRWTKHIYDTKGRLITDPYNIPFRMPEGPIWPFQDITVPYSPPSVRLLNYAYYPLYVLKGDAKGDVIRALYFRRPWQIRSCLIKQGRREMFTDAWGRTIQDRLNWQNELYQALHEDIPMPKVFDYFIDHENAYLAMDFIKGITLTTWIIGVCRNRCWRHLMVQEQLALLDMLLKILSIIQKMHNKGFVHRDITPDNFLIDRNRNIFLIDMELAWCATRGFPNPPFPLGTPGHMSPEQMRLQTPTIKEDIFAIGSLIITFFIGLHALKLKDHSPSALRRSLIFFTHEPAIVPLIVACWNEQPSQRPALDELSTALTGLRQRLQKGTPKLAAEDLPQELFTNKELKKVIQAGLNYLASPGLLNPKGRWLSLSRQNETAIGNIQEEMDMYEGWHTGMAGPLWLVALAKEADFSVTACQRPYEQSWNYIYENYFSEPSRQTPDLFAGSAGIALALVEGLQSGLLPPEPKVLEALRQCFLHQAKTPDLAEGLAGQGIALLQCKEWLDPVEVETLLTSYVNTLIATQQSGGAWNQYTGLEHGTAGILLFLLNYIGEYPSDVVRTSTQKGLDWLERNGKKEYNMYTWSVSIGSKLSDYYGVNHGIHGITLTLIKAYEVLALPKYQEMALTNLKSLPLHPVRMDLSLGSGLSGWGELYLEAFRVFKDPIWLGRAEWIVQLLFGTFQNSRETTGYWDINLDPLPTADLFPGNGGALHFLLRFDSPDKLNHPFIT